MRWPIVAAAVLSTFSIATSGRAEDPNRDLDPIVVDRALARGVAWLVKQQADDGGWHSVTYGALKAGPATTTLTLATLGELPDDIRRPLRPAIDRGFAFVAPGVAKRGMISAADGSLDYPTYATALWLVARRAWKIPPDAADERAAAYLLDAQCVESRGFAQDHPSHGGWDLLGPSMPNGVTTGTNVSVTVYVLEALADADSARALTARKHALAWLERCRRLTRDGGFSFTPESPAHAHKAGVTDEEAARAFSYGSATADGLRGLHLAGAADDDASVRQALTWLARRPGIEIVPGFEHLPPEIDWQRGLRFYYARSLARSLDRFAPPDAVARRRALAQSLVAAQRPDGSWLNDSSRMREDDPLIATCLAISALHNARKP